MGDSSKLCSITKTPHTMKDKPGTQMTTGTFELVRGNFSPQEARELVNDLFSKKINFNELKIFSEEIRYGHKDQHLKQRVMELKQSREQANLLIAEAEQEGKTLRIDSSISLDLL